jgi:peptidoglycan/xylan/chitin deacetylase (PgdA/CDA1 family)
MINVMYHYVRPDDSTFPFFNNLGVDVFCKQLDFFNKEYGFLSKDEYMNSIREGRNVEGVVLTFDDGFRDHYQYVLPELEKRGLWGIFYIATGIYGGKKKQLLDVHRVHFLRGRYGAKKILEELESLITDEMIDRGNIEKFRKNIYTSNLYKDEEKRLRELLNYLIKYRYRNEILDKLMLKFFDEEKLYEEAYLHKNELISLVEHGNIVGSHTYSHKVLSRLTYKEQFDEIKRSFDDLDFLVEQNYKSFCYPHGYKGTYDNRTIEILKELEVDDACVFDNKVHNNPNSKFEISRIDCNNFINLL